jgi:hypothetical protein
VRRNLTLLGVLGLLLWLALGFARPWYGPPSHIARAEWSGSIEVQTWAPPWDRDAVEFVELYRVKRAEAKVERLAKAENLNNRDGRFWLIFSKEAAAGEQFYIVAHLRSGKAAPKQDITRVLTHYETFQQPYFVYSMPLFLLGVVLITIGQSMRRSEPVIPASTEQSVLDESESIADAGDTDIQQPSATVAE